MAIWDYFRKKPEEVKEKLIDIDNNFSDPQWTNISIGGMGLPEKSANLLQEYISWTYANISAISESVGDIDFELYEVKGEDLNEVKEHPILELLHRPNQAMTKREFVYLLQTYRLLTGESPIRIRKVGNEIKELWPLNPLQLTPIIGKTADGFEMVVRYDYVDQTNGETKNIPLKPEEVIFMKNVNPKNQWRGYGVVEAAQGSIDTMHYSELFNQTFFKNSAVPYTILYTDQKLSQESIDRLKNKWDSNYKGPANAFQTAILEAGLKVEKLQTSSKDMDFIEQQRFLRDKLMAMFKTTKIALGITEDVNRANAEASEYVFSKNCVRPKMAQFVESFNEFLLPLFDDSENLFLDFVDPVPKDRVLKIAEYTAAVDKWMTKNEIRDEEGLPPLEGGDEIWQPLSLTIMSNPTPNTPEVQTTPQSTEQQGTQPTEENQPQETEQLSYRIMKVKGKKQLPPHLKEKVFALKNRNIRLKQMKEDIKTELKKILKSRIKPKAIVKYELKYKDMRTQQDTDLYVKSLLSNSYKFEKDMNETMKWKYYQPQMEYIMEKLNKGTKFILPKMQNIQKKIGSEFMWDQEEYLALGIDLLTPQLKEILIAQGSESMLTVKPDLTYSLLDAARKYLNQKPKKVAKTITETAYTRVRDSLSEGIKSGESIPKLKNRVIEEYKSLEKFQAENIARTEVSRATNFATIDAFKQSGVVEGKEWIVTSDDRLCEYCAAMESEYNATTGLDEDYFKIGDEVKGTEGGIMKVDFENVAGPPLHNQCRCVLKSVEKLIHKGHTDKIKKKKIKKEDQLINEIDNELKKIRNKKINVRNTTRKSKKKVNRKA